MTAAAELAHEEAELAHEDEEIGFGAATEAELAHAEELTGAGVVIAFTGADAATVVSC